MGRYTDEQLAQLMCQIYVEYYDTKTELIDDLIEKKINQKIRELSNNTQKTEKHLKSLIDDFFGSFTPEQQRKIKITKDEIKKHKKITVLDRIEGLSEEELREYLKTVPAHKITAKLNSIIERIFVSFIYINILLIKIIFIYYFFCCEIHKTIFIPFETVM